jgi:hypothetical protein
MNAEAVDHGLVDARIHTAETSQRADGENALEDVDAILLACAEVLDSLATLKSEWGFSMPDPPLNSLAFLAILHGLINEELYCCVVERLELVYILC